MTGNFGEDLNCSTEILFSSDILSLRMSRKRFYICNSYTAQYRTRPEIAVKIRMNPMCKTMKFPFTADLPAFVLTEPPGTRHE